MASNSVAKASYSFNVEMLSEGSSADIESGWTEEIFIVDDAITGALGTIAILVKLWDQRSSGKETIASGFRRYTCSFAVWPANLASDLLLAPVCAEPAPETRSVWQSDAQVAALGPDKSLQQAGLAQQEVQPVCGSALAA